MIRAYINPGDEKTKPFLSLLIMEGPNQASVFWQTTPAELRKLASDLERANIDRKGQQLEAILNEVAPENYYAEIGGES